jgi:hypothetical protein
MISGNLNLFNGANSSRLYYLKDERTSAFLYFIFTGKFFILQL